MSCEKIVVPSSNADHQIFPLGTCSNDFNTGDYDPQFANGIAIPQEIIQVINDIQLSRKPFVHKKWLVDLLLILVYFVVVILAVFIRVLFVGTSNILGLIIMVVIISLCTAPIDAVYKKKLESITKESKDACYKMLDEKYKVLYEAKGLRWYLPTDFPRWVELQRIQVYGSNQQTAQPIYLPPAMH